ncbi:WD40 repeat domain-containing protein [Crocinitomicaceae bacterium]|nr:WD40 repeat domain-containing protein [Crocinitomicaceae bacterium]
MIAVLLAPLSWLLLEEMTSDQRNLNDAALSPNQTMVATAHGSGSGVKYQIRIWDARDGSNLRTIGLDRGPVWVVSWSPDGEYVAFGDHDGTLTVLETRGWQVKRKFERQSGMLRKIVWAHGSNRLATGDEYGALRVWDLDSGRLQYTARPHTGNIADLSWSPDDQYIATASWDQTAVISDSKSGELVYRLEGHSAYVTCVAWSSDGKAIATGSSSEPNLLLWRMEGGSSPVAAIGHRLAVEKIEWSPALPLLASASKDDTVRVWDETGTLIHVFEMRGSGSPDLMWSGDGSLLAAANDESVSIWDFATDQLRHRFVAHDDDYDIQILGWSPDRRRLTTRGSWDDTVKVWDISEGKAVAKMHVGLIEDWF